MITFQKVNLTDYEKNVVVTDKNVARIYKLRGANVFVLPCGERAKSLSNVQKLCRFFLQRNLQKDDTVVAVGGGTVGDVTAFCCSIFKRGVKLLHVPTTLVAQIDSSIGGKTAVNLDGVKNAVGTFYNADTVIDTAFLQTLPPREMLSGQGELVKYRMLSSAVDNVANGGNLDQIVKECALFKQAVCERDPFDKGERKTLNAGHTIGHAMELSSKISHGEAVANGLYYELILAQKTGVASQNFVEKWQTVLKNTFTIHKLSAKTLANVKHDKKNADGKIGFALIGENGATYVKMAPDELYGYLKNVIC